MIDLQLPRPLLSPSAWPNARESLLSIAQVSLGGAFDRLWEKPQISVSVPIDFWSGAVGREPSLGVLAKSRFENRNGGVEIVSTADLNRAEQAAWRRVAGAESISFKADPKLSSPTLMDWSREVFPESFRDAGEIVWRRDLQAYEIEINSPLVSMDALRFWPGFLKSKKSTVAQTAAREWAFAQVLFSPQDDQQGSGEIVILNPTVQTTESGEGLMALWRVDHQLMSRLICWSEAAVVDELRENPRHVIAQLQRALESKSYPFKDKPDFGKLIANLTGEGLILRRAF